MPTQNVATTRQSCRHVLVPGDAHCATCGEQILYTGLERTRWQRFTLWVAGVVCIHNGRQQLCELTCPQHRPRRPQYRASPRCTSCTRSNCARPRSPTPI